ncbi:hypothetical protein M8J76_016352 [Diaphorina citri]|nr:hypothetical protein M8J76_016352 [Diaphorina citri]
MASKKTDNVPAEDVLEEMCPSDDEGGCYIGDVYIPPPPPVIKKFKTKGQPRLIIHSIEITNFKSYAGTQILGPFCKSFNAIIGPNGSGKSNVIDAMLFVFGSRASRIRCTNNQSLVHNSESVRNCDSCTVTVKFVEIIDQAQDAYDIVPESDIRITRTAYKYNNISYYYINERQVAFKEIAKLLKKHGVDLINNRFLILQGEVEQISQLPCKGKTPRETGLLEYLEEIIGTHRYIGPLTQLRQRIDHHEAEREQRLERLNAVKTNVETLSSEVEKCLAYFKKENAVRTMEHQIAQVNLARVQDIAAGSAKKKQDMEKQCEERRHRVALAEAEVSVKQQDLAQVEAEMSDMNRAVIGLEDAIRMNKNKITSYEASNKEIQKKLSKYKSEYAAEISKEKKARETPATNESLIASLEKELGGYEAKAKEEEARLEATVATIAEELRRRFDEAKSEYNLAMSELSVYTSTEVEHKQKIEKLKAALEETSQRYEESKEQIAHIQSSLPDNEAQLKARSSDLERLRQRELQGGIDLRKYQDQASEIKDKMQSHSSRNQLIDFVMKLKRNDVVSGILGRLGDLGAIDEQYDQAVSTSCGSLDNIGDLGAIDEQYDQAVSTSCGSLDNIVCETVESCQQVLAEVKRANVGRVYLMALDQMGQYLKYCDRPRNTPGGLPRMFDLIRVEDERIRPAMYCATQTTLVAPTLAQAMKVGYEHHVRVVSLQGDIIEPSGIMSGGGRTRITGKMGRSVRVATDPESTVQNLKKINRKMDNLEKELANIRSQKGNLEKTVSELKLLVTQQRKDLEKLSIDIPSLEMNLPALQKQIRDLEAELKQCVCDPKQVKKMSDDVKKKKSVMDKCEEQAKKLEEKVAKVHEEIMGISAGKTSAIKKSLGEAQRKLNKAKSTLNNLRVEIKRSERDVVTCTQRATSLHEEMTKLGKTVHDNNEFIEIYRGQIDESEAEWKVKNAELKETKTAHGRSAKELARLSASRDKEEESLERLERELRTVRHKAEEHAGEMRQVEARMRQIRLNPLTRLYDLEEVFARANSFEEEPDLSEELEILSPDELRTLDVEALESQITKLETELKFMDFNESRVAEYKQKVRDYAKRSKEMQAVLATLNTYCTGYEQCLSKRQKEFDTNFVKIGKRVQECYQMLTFGGKADLEYKEYSDPYAQGIKYVVRPPRKSWKSIDCLSGGEKTLASLALVFALHYYSPSPLYFLDEIDAALDTPNVAIIGHFIRTRTKFAQFIIISLRHEMFELATHLIGIYQQQQFCTRSLTITKEICKSSQATESGEKETDSELMVDIDDSDDEDEDDNENTDDNSQHELETEESIPGPAGVGPGAGAPLSGDDDTEADDMDTEGEEFPADSDHEEVMDVEEHERKTGRRGRKRRESDESSDRRIGRKRKESPEGVDSSEDEQSTKRRGRPRRKDMETDIVEAPSKRLRVRGVKQINEGPLPTPVAGSLQEYIRQHRTSTPKETRETEPKRSSRVRRQLERSEDKIQTDDGSLIERNSESVDRSVGGETKRGVKQTASSDESVHDTDVEIPLQEEKKRRGRPPKVTAPIDESLRQIEKAIEQEEMELEREHHEEIVEKKRRGRKPKARPPTSDEESLLETTQEMDEEISVQEEMVEPIVEKKKRGRKPKARPPTSDEESLHETIQEMDEDISLQEEVVEQIVEKKKRGRKPKARPPTSDEESLLETTQEMKEDISVQEEVVEERVEKKKRGRKPKARLPTSDEESLHETTQEMDEEISLQEEEEEEVAEQIVEKKRRGRKPKARPPTSDEESLHETTQEMDEEISLQEEVVEERVEKKKRGRKPKARPVTSDEESLHETIQETEEDISVQEEVVEEIIEKKRRGRKPKARPPTSDEESLLETTQEMDEEISLQEELVEEVVQKKKRGRKPKARPPTSDEESLLETTQEMDEEISLQEEVVEPIVEKKKRGRKPKARPPTSDEESLLETTQEMDEEISLQEELVEEVVQKKKRGRKPKARPATSDEESLHETTQEMDEEISLQEEVVEQIVEKKKRGRKPRARPPTSDDESLHDPVGVEDQGEMSQEEDMDEELAEEVVEKKKRGRKRKQVVESHEDKDSRNAGRKSWRRQSRDSEV